MVYFWRGLRQKFTVLSYTHCYLTQKKNQRMKALEMSTSLTMEQKEDYKQFMEVDYMPSEHSVSESEPESTNEGGYESPDVEKPKKKVFSVSSLPWRSCELTSLMRSLDRKVSRRRSEKSTNMLVERKNTNIVSSRPAPEDANPFASQA